MMVERIARETITPGFWVPAEKASRYPLPPDHKVPQVTKFTAAPLVAGGFAE